MEPHGVSTFLLSLLTSPVLKDMWPTSRSHQACVFPVMGRRWLPLGVLPRGARPRGAGAQTSTFRRRAPSPWPAAAPPARAVWPGSLPPAPTAAPAAPTCPASGCGALSRGGPADGGSKVKHTFKLSVCFPKLMPKITDSSSSNLKLYRI